jgi:uncharacterized protein YbbK (DUF523 family)
MEKKMNKEKPLISSCLLGNLVKYNGDHNGLDMSIIKQLEEKYILYPVCPEVDGGLPTPRIPCEIVSNKPMKIYNKLGVDKTKEFIKGAEIAYDLCKKENIPLALMKANSPSCSNSKINDGTFTKNRIDGFGVTVQKLKELDIKIYNEKQIDKIV